jgi:hypothetical protein
MEAAMAKMRVVQVARAGGPLELVEREMPEHARAEFHHPFRPADGSRGESALGHEDAFPRPRLSACYPLGKPTFAGAHIKGRDAP